MIGRMRFSCKNGLPLDCGGRARSVVWMEPDIRGATTIGEQLAKHRDVVTCNKCHRRIDPPGFALEAFDEMGRSARTARFRLTATKRDLPLIHPGGSLGATSLPTWLS